MALPFKEIQLICHLVDGEYGRVGNLGVLLLGDLLLPVEKQK